MIKTLITFFLAVTIFSSCSTLNESTKETTDQYWNNLSLKSVNQNVSILDVLKKENPHLLGQIEADSHDPVLLKLWGKSLNFDSGAKKQILNETLIADLQKVFGVFNDNKIVHAGITHTYGYLFSTLVTPYGFKRKRWIEPTLNVAFSFKKKDLSPMTEEGALLSNLTYFAGKIVFKDPHELKLLEELKNVSSEVKNFHFSTLNPLTLIEELDHFPFALKTTLIKLPKKLAVEENDALLLYTLISKTEHSEVLITAFPIKNDAYIKIIDPSQLGEKKEIILRYNAFVLGLSDQKLVGTRRIQQ